ncbi:uridine kinase [Halobacteriovorax sp. JY17]|uniref:uridine kinase n=1 Tax=Halobacteriovorax sp. JY17 TaxID=2014617 RepID=UPI000C4B4F2E|nr:uridine kinase [Halobacteriovorax sp. JY17]PIK14943.1 MAG: uridine kinase [Halobacteriovorax sp. JY17]
MEVIIVGVAGGSGSGKTTFARRLREKLGESECCVLGQDSYYFDQSNKFDHDGGSVNFDHPESLDFDLLAKHLSELKKGHSIDVPVYDFATHSRSSEPERMEPRKYIFVDGILIFSQPQVVKELDYKIFIDCPEDLRFERRLHRDIHERGRTKEGVRNQFYKQVKPMHDLFVEPSKTEACDIINVENFVEKVDKWGEKLVSTP